MKATNRKRLQPKRGSDSKSKPRLFFRNEYPLTVLNWHREPEEEFGRYGLAFWRAAQSLLKNEQIDRFPGADADGCMIVYLYRHSLELFMKGILLGPGRELMDEPMSSSTVLKGSHSLIKMLPALHSIFREAGWDERFGPDLCLTFGDFSAIVKEFEDADPSGAGFRYPIQINLDEHGNPKASFEKSFSLCVRKFGKVMDEVLGVLAGATSALPEIVNMREEVAHEARCADEENTGPGTF